MKVVFTDNIASVQAQQWNNLAGDSNPFIQHDFLLALEQHDCLKNWGWMPQHCLLYDKETLIGACPAYIKDNSYGEFVFDWAWADAYERANIPYYPKLVISIPYSPVTGPRLLAKNNDPKIKAELLRQAISLAKKINLSSVHWLFNNKEDQIVQNNENLLERIDYQFHWNNNNYQDFDDFLGELTSKKRKNIKQERRKVKSLGVNIDVFNGKELNEEQWQQIYNFYQITFMKKSGTATLTLDFFKSIKRKIVVFMASSNLKPVAAAICIKGKNTLYGRHWGCYEEYDSLHFELCYYTGIEYCIKNKLNKFEPGAQGEHKIPRGFLPQLTRSFHWVDNMEFRKILENHLTQETLAIEEYGQKLSAASPFKKFD